MQTPARSVHGVMDEMRQIHMDYRNPVEEKGWQGHSLSEREGRLSPLPGQAFLGLICIGIQGIYVKLISHCQAEMIKQ